MVSSVHLFIDDFERAREQAQGIVEMFPDSHLAYRILGLAYLGENLFEHAIGAFEKGSALTRDPVSVALLTGLRAVGEGRKGPHSHR